MEADTYQEIQALSRLTVGQLREKYLDVFGEETRSRHKEFLRKRIAWRLQGEVVPASGKDPEGGTATDKFTVVLETAPSGASWRARPSGFFRLEADAFIARKASRALGATLSGRVNELRGEDDVLLCETVEMVPRA